ncbi:MAG: AraC family transcriptional regulator [Chitinophagaceae bacterium]
MENDTNKKAGIVYSCYYQMSREGEHFVPEHSLTCQIAGSLVLNDGTKEYSPKAGSIRLIRRNHLIKFIKQPPPNGEFKSITIYLQQQILKDYSLEYGIASVKKQGGDPVIVLKNSPAMETYISSLLAYQKANSLSNDQFVAMKQKEAVFLLLQSNPSLKNILFDFSEPHKIDLEAFMNKNFHFNVHLDRFAYLTGRSLATFKRDFEKQFNSTPGHWLQQKRLQEAYYLIAKKGKTASDVYLDLGFEDLSHFSYAFKKKFGEAPSKVLRR